VLGRDPRAGRGRTACAGSLEKLFDFAAVG